MPIVFGLLLGYSTSPNIFDQQFLDSRDSSPSQTALSTSLHKYKASQKHWIQKSHSSHRNTRIYTLPIHIKNQVRMGERAYDIAKNNDVEEGGRASG